MGNDYFQFKQFTLRQSRCAMKVGTDGTLLGAWAGNVQRSTFNVQRSTFNVQRSILDVGTGTGLIALMMAQRFPEARVVGIDIDAEAVLQARENVAASPFADRIEILHSDFSEWGTTPLTPHLSPLTSHPSPLTSPFSAIVCNPPFFASSLKNPDARRSLARHADSTAPTGEGGGGLTYRQLMQCSRNLLSDDGDLSVIIPVSEQGRMECEAALAGFFKSRECMVRTSPRKVPKRVLMAFRKHSTPLERTELVIGSEAYKELTKDFYLQ